MDGSAIVSIFRLFFAPELGGGSSGSGRVGTVFHSRQLYQVFCFLYLPFLGKCVRLSGFFQRSSRATHDSQKTFY